VHRYRGLLGVGLLLLGGLIVVFLALDRSAARSEPVAFATSTPEPIVPTRTSPAAVVTRTLSPTSARQGTAVPRVSSTLTPVGSAVTPMLPGAAPFWTGRPRWGVGVVSGPISRYDVEPLRLGWYLDWQARAAPVRPGGALYAQMVRLGGGQLRPAAEQIAAIAQANPGSLWLVGNEPDVKWQDNVPPATYAQLYHDAYAAIKGADPTALVAIGGVSQPTPLRMRYLDLVLASYRVQFGVEMPIDVWNVHGFVLREERGSWGVNIPPGMADDRGMLYEIADSGNLEAFKRQIVDFRRWMAQRGYQDWPLIVSEYGILMPADYGFPPEVVISFMTASFDFFLTTADPAVGYPADGNRLVQMWCWYSLDAPADYYPTGNLFDPEMGGMTAVGQAWTDYVR